MNQNVLKPALAIVAVSLLARPGKAATIDNCGATLPCYTIHASMPDGNTMSDSELAPVEGTFSGIDTRLIGDGSGFAVAAVGRLGARTEATNTSPVLLIDAPVSASAGAKFDDSFTWAGGPGRLRFTLSLEGAASASGADPGQNTAFVLASLSLSTAIAFDAGFGRLTAPGSITVTVGVAETDDVGFFLDLTTGVALNEFGHGVSDFKNTLDVSRVELLNNSGNFVRDVTLTDRSGNVLGAAASTAPEASTFVFVGAGLIAVHILAGAARKIRTKQEEI